MATAIRAKSSRTAGSRKQPTPRRILVASTGESESRGALNMAGALCERDPETKVLALGVATPFPHNVSTLVSLKQPVSIDEESRREVLELLRRAVHRIPHSDTWEKMALVGMPPDEINRIASRWRASYIILGLGRHNRLDRIFGSETAITVMRHARIPVLAVPATTATLPEHALVAMDFTDASMAAASLAAELVSTTGTVTIAHVCGFSGAPASPGDLIDLYRAGAQAKLEAAVKKLRRRAPCKIEDALLEGEPAAALLDFAKRRHCDLIALGGHELGLVDRIVLGSIRTKVVRGATCPVLIAPPKV